MTDEIKCPVCGKLMGRYIGYRDGHTVTDGLPPKARFAGCHGFRCNMHGQPWEFVLLSDGSEWGFINSSWRKVSFTTPPKPRKGKLIGSRLFQQ